jgi:hypothetical protein
MELNENEIAKDFNNIKSLNYHKVWEPFMRKYKCDIVCELGVFKGDNFVEMVKHKPKLAVAVDEWRDSGLPRKYDVYTQSEFDEQYEFFKERVSNMPFVQIIRDDTAKASKLFPDNHFDFVYIDADHSVEGSYADIINWYPKVKSGKFLVGHDYRRGFGVVEAVNRFTEEKGLKLLFLSPSTWALVKK